MSETSDLVTIEEVTYINTPCPDWCTLKPLHPVDNQSLEDPRNDCRMHGGPKFGEFLDVSGAEYVSHPGSITPVVGLYTGDDDAELGPLELRELARHAVEAAEWLEAQA